MVKNMLYHFYGNTTDIYTKVLERTPVYEKSVKAFHDGDEYVAILYKVATQRTQFYGDILVSPQELVR
jgi:hypothetical protein